MENTVEKLPFGINIFEDRKAQRRFLDVIEFLPLKQKEQFTKKVRVLFDKKTVSLEGEYYEFKITVADINAILETLRKQG